MTKRLINPESDPFLWLEDVEGDQALTWVEERNRQAEQALQDQEFARLKDSLREILDASDRIPGVTKRGDWFYNFWTDTEHPQGIWRRTTLESYRSETPEWETLLDLDALSETEGITWVWHGAAVLRPEQTTDEEIPGYSRALIDLSPGGSDADVTREFDLNTGKFIEPQDGGFYRPEGKGGLSWIDAHTVYAYTDQPGPSDEAPVTTSGYPRVATRWQRGTELSEAEPIISVAEDDMLATAGYDSTPGHERHLATRVLGFYDSETYLIDYEEGEPRLTRVDVPTDVRTGFHRDLIFFAPRTDARVAGVDLPGGSLYVADAEEFIRGAAADETNDDDGEPRPVELTPLFIPTESTSLQGITATRNIFALTIMEDVVEHVEAHWRDEQGQWTSQRVLSGITGSLSVGAYDSRETDDIWITANDFLTPTTKYLGTLAPVLEGRTETYEVIKQAPERFDSEGLAAVQRFATSEDGTEVPYFLIGPAEAVEAATEGAPRESIAGTETKPTLLYGYGGFEISLKPRYLPLVGKAWLETGGVFAMANIRGGGEYGPRWHQAALKENRPRTYEDFAAVARDLVSTGVTTVEQLACQGGSNGGLLTGNMLTRYPELFGAVVIQVPLLDMKRYAQLLAGASWRAEYGDPETSDWEFIQNFSAYHLLDRQQQYPPVLLTTSTKDDRVHPGHARKMTAALEEIGADVTYWENTQGGHGGAANPEQQATMNALIYRWLGQQLGI
ncbi:S9 family peptidase [Nesterenkonia sp. MY13]|uniref:S9 family peptidase n=1 Tax=Nesterenkonia sedimenti TaxID=1463632 RepID=A0A7X8TK47_9MICC|nr:prolyl oligopeptidase family serine peptidase [Nesterenkonia sedimenti]NLS09538.1 S9 family peptidase [Nesterenkonia sedimenti]